MNNNRNRDRNERGYNRDWDEREGYNQNSNYEDSRNDYQNRRPGADDKDNNRNNNDRSNFRNDQARGNYNQNNRAGRYGENENNYNRAAHSYSTGTGRGYLGDQDDYNRGYGRNRGYTGNDYGNYDNNRERNDDRDWWDKTKDEVSSWFGDDEASRRRQTDEKHGKHKGRGPKGYTRSDERIKEDINDRLMDDTHIDASDIEVSIDKGEVVLTGTVESRFEKRHAEDLAESVSGVKNVENRIRISSNSVRNNTGISGSNSGSAPGSSGAYPVGAFDIDKS